MDWFGYINSFVQFWMYYLFTAALLPKKYSRAATLLWATALALLEPAAAFLTLFSVFRMLLALLPIAAMVFFLFDSSVLRKALCFFAAAVLPVFSDAIFSMLILGTDVLLKYNSLDTVPRLMIIIPFDVFLIVVFTVTAAILKRSFGKRDASYDDGRFSLTLLTALIPFIMILIWYKYVLVNSIEPKPVSAILPLFVCILAEVALFLLQSKEASLKSADAELQRLKELTEAQQKYYSALSVSYGETRRMRHDIQNHLLTIQALLSDNKAAEAEQYADDISAAYKRNHSVNLCEHSILDSYLFFRVKQMREKGIEPSLSLCVPADIGIDSTDLISAFGNLLDNAEEALNESEDKQLTVTVSRRRGYLIILTENACASAVIGAKKQRIPGLSRGIGSTVLKGLAEKYDGQFSVESVDGKYRTQLMLNEMK